MIAWKEYEARVLKYFKSRHPEAVFSANKNLRGKFSHTDREIDILLEGEAFGLPIIVAIECKNWSSKLDVADIGSFIDKLKDTGISKGVIVSRFGFSESAYTRAQSETDLQLHVIDFENLPEHCGFWARAYRGHIGALLSAPNGWVINSLVPKTLIEDRLCSVHPAEYNVQEAMIKRRFMYFQLLPMVDDYNLSNAMQFQDENVRKSQPSAVFKYWEETSANGKVIMREIRNEKNNYTEYTAGIQGDDFFGYFVYVAPWNFLNEDLARLRFVLRELKLIKIKGANPFDSHESWRKLWNGELDQIQ
jgi:hypothetical protein